jgi:uncharacterized RDD family membrane protein YckC
MRPTAGFFRRIFADCLDSVFMMILVFPLALLLGVASESIVHGGALLIAFLYYPLQEASRFQATLGQRCLKMRVCSLTFERLTFQRAFFREVMKYLLAVPLMIFLILEGLSIYFPLQYFVSETNAVVILVFVMYVSASIGSLCLLYVRLFRGGTQTARDYYSKTMMVLSET